MAGFTSHYWPLVAIHSMAFPPTYYNYYTYTTMPHVFTTWMSSMTHAFLPLYMPCIEYSPDHDTQGSADTLEYYHKTRYPLLSMHQYHGTIGIQLHQYHDRSGIRWCSSRTILTTRGPSVVAVPSSNTYSALQLSHHSRRPRFR